MFSLYCTGFPIAKITYSIANMRIFVILKLEMCQYDTVGDIYERKIALGIRDVQLLG